MLGVQLAEALGKKVGDKVEMEGAEFEVVAVYQSKNVYENGSAILPLAEMQRLMDRPNQVTAFQVALHFSPELEQRRDEVRAAIDGLRDENGRSLYLSAMPAREYAQTTIQILMFRAMAWTTSMLALIIGAIGMLNTMIMSVFEQTKQIGILRAIGWRKGRVMRMILGESLLLCLAGAAVGTLGAVGLVRWLSTLSTAAAYIRGDTPPEVIGLGFGVAVVVGLLGGLYPAYRGASLLPTEAIRHE
jgi:putative ABC transport system permease protein